MKKISLGMIRKRLTYVCMCVAITGCATVDNTVNDARKFYMEAEALKELPEANIGSYSGALSRLGQMLAVYKMGDSPIYIQSRNITDSTNLSNPYVGAEIPGDITEMTRTALNKIGRYVVYIPYHPEYVVAQSQIGAKFGVTQPSFLLTGALTEFDRGISGAGRSNNLYFGFGKGKGKTNTSSDTRRTALYSSLALDFNVVDFRTQQMIPRIQSSNAVKVLQLTSENNPSLGFYGNTFGFKMEAKYLQGRHSAVRTLVELSVLEIIGKLANIPYWRCLPDGKPDELVYENMQVAYTSLPVDKKISFVQITLRKYGENVPVTGKMDRATEQALIRVYYNKLPIKQTQLDIFSWEGFAPLFFNIPMPWENYGVPVNLPESLISESKLSKSMH